jgi:hypothetical protein
MAERTYITEGQDIDTEWNQRGQGVVDPFMEAMNTALRSVTRDFNSGQVPIFTNQLSVKDQESKQAPVFLVQPTNTFNTEAGTGKIGASATSASDPFKALTASMNDFDKIKDPTEKYKALIALEASAGTLFTEKAKATRIAAENQLGVKQLREALAFNEQEDRNHPDWPKYQTDGKITAGIRQKLMQTEGQVDAHAQRLLKEDGELARFIKTVEGFGSLQRSLIQKEELKAIAGEAAGAKKAESIQNFVATIPMDVRASFIKADERNKDDAVFAANFLNEAKDAKNTGNMEALRNGSVRPENYFQAGLEGNPVALRFAAVEQADRTGLPMETVRGQLTLANRLVNSDSDFDKLAPVLLKGPELKAYATAKALAGSDTRSQAQLKSIRVAAVNNYMGRLQQEAIDQDITKWSRAPGEAGIDQLPGAAEVIKEMTAKGQKDIGSFATAYLAGQNLTPQEVAQRADLLAKQYATTLTRVRDNGIYGTNIDVIGAVNYIKTKASLNRIGVNSLAKRAGEATGEALNTAAAYQSPLTSLMRAGVNQGIGTLREFSSGLLGE